jgi:hypothetical protein
MKRRGLLLFVLAALALGCARGGVTFTGDQAKPAPELPADEAVWLNGRGALSKLGGQVVLVEAWHPW